MPNGGLAWDAVDCELCAALEPALSEAPDDLDLNSLTAVEEELGVPWLELEGDRVDEKMPPEEPLSFFLEDLFESFARESCSC